MQLRGNTYHLSRIPFTNIYFLYDNIEFILPQGTTSISITRRPASADRTASVMAAVVWGEVCAVHALPMGVGPFAFRYQGNGTTPCQYWYHSKGNWLRYNFTADSFYIMKLCSRLLVLYCRYCPKDDKFRYLTPILRKLGAA